MRLLSSCPRNHRKRCFEVLNSSTYRITYPPPTSLPEPRIHDGYEWLYVLAGKLRLILGERDLVLGRGEAAEFDTRIPHSVSAAGGKPAQVLSIFNDAGARMHTYTAPDAESA